MQLCVLSGFILRTGSCLLLYIETELVMCAVVYFTHPINQASYFRNTASQEIMFLLCSACFEHSDDVSSW
jgi:hypothetical protein